MKRKIFFPPKKLPLLLEGVENESVKVSLEVKMCVGHFEL